MDMMNMSLNNLSPPSLASKIYTMDRGFSSNNNNDREIYTIKLNSSSNISIIGDRISQIDVLLLLSWTMSGIFNRFILQKEKMEICGENK